MAEAHVVSPLQVEQAHSSDSGSDSDGSTSTSHDEEQPTGRDGSDGAAAPQKQRKPAYGKSRAAALDLLQGVCIVGLEPC